MRSVYAKVVPALIVDDEFGDAVLVGANPSLVGGLRRRASGVHLLGVLFGGAIVGAVVDAVVVLSLVLSLVASVVGRGCHCCRDRHRDRRRGGLLSVLEHLPQRCGEADSLADQLLQAVIPLQESIHGLRRCSAVRTAACAENRSNAPRKGPW